MLVRIDNAPTWVDPEEIACVTPKEERSIVILKSGREILSDNLVDEIVSEIVSQVARLHSEYSL